MNQQLNLNDLPSLTQDTPKKRKNKPEQLRHSLIIAARDLILRDGIQHLSMQKVADQAGVSKGGLFHHFKSKDELLMAVIGLFIAQLNTAILGLTDQYGQAFGCFSRAYATVMLTDETIGIGSDWSGLIRTINAESQMQAQWQDWLGQKLQQFATTDQDPRLTLVRYAVDGAWLDAQLSEAQQEQVYQALLAYLDNL